MKLLISSFRGIFTGVFKLWGKAKEWSAKKKMALFSLIALVVVVTPVSIYFIGWDQTVLAFQIVNDLLASLVTIL